MNEQIWVRLQDLPALAISEKMKDTPVFSNIVDECFAYGNWYLDTAYLGGGHTLEHPVEFPRPDFELPF